jgi:predicted SprT family Zn-dependent metalloprotease
MADLALIQELAEAALADWQDDIPGWTFGWNNRTSSLGLCVYRKKQVQVSSIWASKLTDDEVMDTVLHEVAHAVAFTVHGCHDHGPVWKKVCMELGCTPKATARTSIPMSELGIQTKWQVLCNDCKTVSLYQRKPKRDIKHYACMVCRRKGQGNGNLVLIQNW